jgi:tRNA pseudouridine-54 N-methylase
LVINLPGVWNESARKLFQKKSFKKAIFHSLRARILAVDLIVLNKKGIMLNEAKLNQAEENYVDHSPPPRELDQTMKTKEKKVLSDDEAIKLLDELGISLFNSNES